MTSSYAIFDERQFIFKKLRSRIFTVIFLSKLPKNSLLPASTCYFKRQNTKLKKTNKKPLKTYTTTSTFPITHDIIARLHVSESPRAKFIVSPRQKVRHTRTTIILRAYITYNTKQERYYVRNKNNLFFFVYDNFFFFFFPLYNVNRVGRLLVQSRRASGIRNIYV